MCRLTEVALGPAWYFNRERWDTWDGYAPFDVVWRAWKTLRMVWAMERVNGIKIARNAQAPAEVLQPLVDADLKEAIGG